MRGDHSKHLLALDGLRGLAAITVMAQHTHWITGVMPAPGSSVIVDFFFCLSGFVLALAASRWDIAKTTFSDICAKRLVRVYPMMVLAMAIAAVPVVLSVALQKSATPTAVFKLALGFAGIPIFARPDAQVYPFNGPVWSLACELLANALYYWCLLKGKSALLLPICIASAIGLIAGALHTGTLRVALLPAPLR